MAPDDVLTQGPLVLFDGVCNLCSASARFLVTHDRTGRLRFAAMQSEAGRTVLRRHGLPLDDWDSFIFLDRGRLHLKSDAAFELARFLRSPWPLLRIGRVLPRPLADWLYDRVARNRYALFGRKEQCMVPSAEIRSRFLA
ncbi:MAG TPA: thiol-disulfide oxidoreductase DCC family protein [Aliidongia sp.]|nr:thiol-disulfide oxidoreductase DCC family protein [Aliidongia sp.]